MAKDHHSPNKDKFHEETHRVRSTKRTDMGNAVRLVKDFGDDIRYCPEWKQWLLWDGSRFNPDIAGQIVRLAARSADLYRKNRYEAQSEEEEGRIGGWGATSENFSRLTSTVKLAATDPQIIVHPEELDTDPFLLNVKNGVVDLKTGKLLHPERKFLQTKMADVIFDPEAKAPLFGEFIKRITDGDIGLCSSLIDLLGYCLTGSVREQKIFLIHGPGQNGKSVLLELIRKLLGDYGQVMDFETLLQTNKSGARPDIARMVGARLITASEANPGVKWDEATVKQLTGGDRLNARLLFKDPFEFDPTHKIICAVNHLPEITGNDDSIWRRVVVIPFDVTIPNSERDNDLLEKLREEKSGILNLLIQGCLDWQRQDLVMPELVKKATDQYRANMDSVFGFIGSKCKSDPDAVTPVVELRTAYESWCESEDFPKVGTRLFASRLEAQGFGSVRMPGGTRARKGIRLV